MTLKKVRRYLKTIWEFLSEPLAIVLFALICGWIVEHGEGDYIAKYPEATRYMGLAILLLTDIFAFNALGYFRRGQTAMGLLPTLMLGIPGLWIFWPFTLWVLIPMEIFFLLVYLALRLMNTCPRCRKPLKESHYTFYNWGAIAPGGGRSVQCPWCGFIASGPNSFVEREIEDERKHCDQQNRMSQDEKAARKLASLFEVEEAFISWYIDNYPAMTWSEGLGYLRDEPFPEDKAPKARDVITYCREKYKDPDVLLQMIIEEPTRFGLTEEGLTMLKREVASNGADTHKLETIMYMACALQNIKY